MQAPTYKEIAQKFDLLPVESESRSTPGSLLEDGLIYAEKDFLDLLEKLRLYCLGATTDNVEYLTNLYKMGIKGIPQVAAAAQECLKQGLSEATGSQYRIDTTDMVWVPWILRKDARFSAAIARKRQQLRVLAVDEAQDTDLLQIEILSELIDPEHSFLIGVGDRQQACFFFRGCLNDGMDRITQRFNGETFPLPVCYRCGVKHLELVREIFPSIPIQPRPNAPPGEIKVIWEKNFLSIFDNAALSYMGISRKNAPLTIAAIRLLAAGKPAKIKDRNIGNRLVSRVREICQRKRYSSDKFPEFLREYEIAQKRRLAKFPDGDAKVSELDDVLQALAALFQAYEPKTLKAWEDLVNRIFDESGYSPISLYSIHSGKGGEGQVCFILNPDELPLEHPKQVKQEREQEQHLLYVALTRTLADGVQGAGILYLVIRSDEKNEGKPKYPDWLPARYRTLKVDPRPTEPDSSWNDDNPEEPDEDDEPGWSELTDEIFALNRFKSTYAAEDLEENNSEVESVANSCSPTIPFEQPETVNDSTPISQSTGDANVCSSVGLDLAELEEKIKRGFNLTRDFYDCGKALTLVRDSEPPLYYPEFHTFEEYCRKRFGKSVRAAQYFMSAAALVDNLLEAECVVIPTAESQVRAIASLPTEQQVEIWEHACANSKGKVPTANQVKKSRAEVLGESLPGDPSTSPVVADEPVESDNQTTATPVVSQLKVLPQPAALLERLKSRVKGTKASLQDVEVLLELVLELTQKTTV